MKVGNMIQHNMTLRITFYIIDIYIIYQVHIRNKAELDINKKGHLC